MPSFLATTSLILRAALETAVQKYEIKENMKKTKVIKIINAKASIQISCQRVHELYNAKGVPYLHIYRRVLEVKLEISRIPEGILTFPKYCLISITSHTLSWTMREYDPFKVLIQMTTKAMNIPTDVRTKYPFRWNLNQRWHCGEHVSAPILEQKSYK